MQEPHEPARVRQGRAPRVGRQAHLEPTFAEREQKSWSLKWPLSGSSPLPRLQSLKVGLHVKALQSFMPRHSAAQRAMVSRFSILPLVSRSFCTIRDSVAREKPVGQPASRASCSTSFSRIFSLSSTFLDASDLLKPMSIHTFFALLIDSRF